MLLVLVLVLVVCTVYQCHSHGSRWQSKHVALCSTLVRLLNADMFLPHTRGKPGACLALTCLYVRVSAQAVAACQLVGSSSCVHLSPSSWPPQVARTLYPKPAHVAMPWSSQGNPSACEHVEALPTCCNDLSHVANTPLLVAMLALDA